MSQEINVATPRPEVVAHLSRIQKVMDLMGGQDAMKAAGNHGDRYIKPYKDEDHDKWKERVESNTLFNGYERTLSYLVGQVFSKDVALEDEDKAHPFFVSWKENVDGKGNNLTVFSKRAFSHGLNEGYVLILVDSSDVQTRDTPSGREYMDDETGDWLPLTAADNDRLGLSPRLVEIRSENILGWRFEIVNGKTQLTMLRFLETYKIKGEWDAGDVELPQVRVLTPGHWQIWRKDEKSDKDKWVLYRENIMPGTEIPVVLFRPGKPLDEMTAASALEALADKNIEHWQKYAEHNWLMQWVRSPGMYVAGAMPDDNIGWGPGVLTKISHPDGKIVAIGVDAASVQASLDELEKIKAEMALFGLQLLMPRTGDVTATEKALSSSESDSTLQGHATEFKDALEQAFEYVGVFIGLSDEEMDKVPGAIVNTEFHALAAFDDQTLAALITACVNGKLPAKVLWYEMRRRGIISEDWTPDKILEALREENLDGTFQAPASKFLRVQGGGQAPNGEGSQASGGSQEDQRQSAAAA